MMHKATVTLEPKTLANAADGAKEVLETAHSKLGFIPNLYGNMANSPGALVTYFSGYNQFREHSGFTPVEQEVVFLTISKENGCGYCIAAHSMIADKMSHVPAQVVMAIRNGEIIQDPKLAALSNFTRRLLQSRGLPIDSEVREFLQAGYKEEQILEIILGIAVKTISNYINHVFNTSIDPFFENYIWQEK
ncbi:carboxymuconolactone decarboxylase family protein [Methyloglobulus morosus]|nr:carboxymuconolactone decarboxylase family protein [Methyloglobulus morosus]